MKEIKTKTFVVRDAVAACTRAQRGGDTDRVGWGGGEVRQDEAGRDLAPCAAGASTWTKISSSSKIQRNSQGPKTTTCGRLWGKLQTTRYKKEEETQLSLLKSQEPKLGVGSKSRVLCVNPTHSTTKGVGGPTSGHIPTLTPRKEPAHPLQGESKGNHDMFSLPLAVAGAPVKPCLNFLSGL